MILFIGTTIAAVPLSRTTKPPTEQSYSGDSSGTICEMNVIAGNTERITANATTDPVRDAGETIRSRGKNLADIAESVTEIEQAVTQTGTRRVRRHATDAVRSVVDEIDALSAPSEITSTSHGSGVGLFVITWSVESLGGEINERHDLWGTRSSSISPKSLPGPAQ